MRTRRPGAIAPACRSTGEGLLPFGQKCPWQGNLSSNVLNSLAPSAVSTPVEPADASPRRRDRLRLGRRSLLGAAGLVILLAALAPFLQPVAA